MNKKKILSIFSISMLIVFSAVFTGCISHEDFINKYQDSINLSPFYIVILLVILAIISEDLSCIMAGILSSNESISIYLGILGCFIGIALGDVILYLIGRFGGKKWVYRPPVSFFIKKKHIKKGKFMLNNNGGKVIFFSRFLPGSRLPIYVTLGMIKYSFNRFILYVLLACTIWVPFIVKMSEIMGSKIIKILDSYKFLPWIILPLLITTFWLIMKLIENVLSYKSRRLIYGRVRRLIEWEFWPAYLTYMPIIIYIIYLGFKYRGITIFTLSNPVMPYGGISKESKGEILKSIFKSSNNDKKDHFLNYCLIPNVDFNNKIKLLDGFIISKNIEYPIVMKPDVGERGKDVMIVHSKAESYEYLRKSFSPIIVQEYSHGIEIGVFYYRYPGDEKGNILSLTEKKLSWIIGDGFNTIEYLILQHPEYVKRADFFINKWRDSLNYIPKEGEKFFLTNIGSHSRGARFTNAIENLTEELLDTINEISKSYEGFYFGRYDIKVNSIDDLKRGERLKILELNGVSSESIHIYTSGYSLLRGYRDLFKQWEIAFEIGKKNQKLGHKPVKFFELLKFLYSCLKS